VGRLSIKTLKRKNLVRGRYKFMVLLKRNNTRSHHATTNAGEIEDLRDMLRGSCRGKFKLQWEVNWRGKRVYTHLYLTEAMDLALLKLVHASKMHKLYRIEVTQPDESPSGSDQTVA
jgi:hypothetical protein